MQFFSPSFMGSNHFGPITRKLKIAAPFISVFHSPQLCLSFFPRPRPSSADRPINKGSFICKPTILREQRVREFVTFVLRVACLLHVYHATYAKSAHQGCPWLLQILCRLDESSPLLLMVGGNGEGEASRPVQGLTTTLLNSHLSEQSWNARKNQGKNQEKNLRSERDSNSIG